MSTDGPALATPIVTDPLSSSRTPSHSHDSAFHTPVALSPLDADCSASDYFMAEDTRGEISPSIDNSVTGPSAADDSQETATTTAPTTTAKAGNEEEHGDQAASTTVRHDTEDPSLLPPFSDRDESSLFPLSENGDQERGNNQTLIEEHEMRRKLMDMESSFLPEPSTIEVAAPGPAAGADDTYLVGVEGTHDANRQQESSQLSSIPPMSENYDDTENENIDVTAAAHAQQPDADESFVGSLASSPTTAAAARIGNRNQSTFSESAPDGSQLFQDDRPFRSHLTLSENESQLTPSKLRHASRSRSPGPSRLFSDQSGSIRGSLPRRGSRPKYLTSRQSANRLSHSSITSNNTDTTHSDATMGADFALQSGGAASEHWGSLSASNRAHMTRTISLGSMASGVSGYSEENSVERRNAGGPAEGGLHTLEEESSPQSSKQQQQQQQHAFDEMSAPETPKAKAQDTNFPTDTAITERVRGIQVPTNFVQRFREDFGNVGPSPEKRAGASTPAFGRSGRTMTLKEQSSTIDRLSKENFDLKMRIHFLNEALNKRSEEGIKEMISENVELKSDKLKLQKDNQGLKRKIRDLEKELKDQQSDKDSMVNHDPDASEDDRDSAQDGEVVFLRERVETYEHEIERLRSESIARESEKRRLAEMVKSLSENRAGGSDAGAREERVCSHYYFVVSCAYTDIGF